jgi:CMP/dCMP kinase
MIITISGKPGSGKTTLAENLVKKLKYKRYSPGKIRRQIATKQGISIEELNKKDNIKSTTDEIVDKKIKELANSDNLIVDGRVGYFFIPNSLKVFVDADLKVIAKRLLNDSSRLAEPIKSEEQAYNDLVKRCDDDQERFKKIYNTDIYDLKNFDLVIDSTSLNQDQILDLVLKKIK